MKKPGSARWVAQEPLYDMVVFSLTLLDEERDAVSRGAVASVAGYLADAVRLCQVRDRVLAR